MEDTIFLHKKTQNRYRLICEGRHEKTHAAMAVYQNIDTNQIWIRPSSEFFDGRFVEDGVAE